MDTEANLQLSYGGFRGWLARHVAAAGAVAIVLAAIAWKNQHYCNVSPASDVVGDWLDYRLYGWPWVGFSRCRDLYWEPLAGAWVPIDPQQYSIDSWPALALDLSVALASAAATWFVFSRTQRRVERWWELSLPTLIAFVALAGIICAILKIEPVVGW